MAKFSRQADVEWQHGEAASGSGSVSAGSAAFSAPATIPRLAGEAPVTTTPEELLAASHAVCYAIALRSILGLRGGHARHIRVTATITADKGPHVIRLQSSHLNGVVEGLTGVEPSFLPEIAHAAEEHCTISIALRPSVPITIEVAAV
jgi:osmotically inducible protein OsmC